MKITIVTVNLNGNRFLAQGIDSVLRQDYPELEYIIIDGGSTDGSLATIEQAAGRDQRISWTSGSDQGIADAMNKGISLASGDVVGFLHSDDCYPSADVITSVVAGFEGSPGAIWLTGGIDFINAQGYCFRSFPVRTYNYNRLIRSNQLFHPATFVRTDILRQNQFDPDLKLAMDYDLWLRIGSLSAPVLLDRSLACFRVHSGSCSIRHSDAALVEEYAIRRHYLRARGRVAFPHYLACLVKRVLNRAFVLGLLKAGSLERRSCPR
jgi:glycosyltransferase involved in cell wall biosynthesis